MTSITFFLVFIPLLAFILLGINLIFAPHNPYQEKNSAFECGFTSFVGQNRTQFSISFFIFALLFLLFDLEILLVYPYLVSSYTNEAYGLVILLIFLGALTLGFAFELGKKALTIDSRQLNITVNNKVLTTNMVKATILLSSKSKTKLFNRIKFYSNRRGIIDWPFPTIDVGNNTWPLTLLFLYTLPPIYWGIRYILYIYYPSPEAYLIPDVAPTDTTGMIDVFGSFNLNFRDFFLENTRYLDASQIPVRNSDTTADLSNETLNLENSVNRLLSFLLNNESVFLTIAQDSRIPIHDRMNIEMCYRDMIEGARDLLEAIQRNNRADIAYYMYRLLDRTVSSFIFIRSSQLWLYFHPLPMPTEGPIYTFICRNILIGSGLFHLPH